MFSDKSIVNHCLHLPTSICIPQNYDSKNNKALYTHIYNQIHAYTSQPVAAPQSSLVVQAGVTATHSSTT